LPLRTVRILRLLAGSSRGLPVGVVARALDEPEPVCSTGLRRLAAYDLVKAEGAGLWHLGEVGRRRLADLDAAVERAGQVEAGWQLLGQAHQLFGPGTRPATRRRATVILRAAGCTQTAIARVFGVSPATTWQDLQACLPGPVPADPAAAVDALDMLAARDQPMVPYQFPLRPGLRVRLVLPELLTRSDADRIAAFVDGLAD